MPCLKDCDKEGTTKRAICLSGKEGFISFGKLSLN